MNMPSGKVVLTAANRRARDLARLKRELARLVGAAPGEAYPGQSAMRQRMAGTGEYAATHYAGSPMLGQLLKCAAAVRAETVRGQQLLRGLRNLIAKQPYAEVASTSVLRERIPQLPLGLLEHTVSGEGINLPARELLNRLEQSADWRGLLLNRKYGDLTADALIKARKAMRNPIVT